MKNPVVFVAFLLCATFSSAQIVPNTPWTWMKGDNTVDHFGEYGTQGIADSTNKPGARSISSTWRDKSGNLWLFGGMGFGTTESGFLNDLWKYNPSTNKWSWIKGNSDPNYYSEYGTRGVASAYNKPGGTYAGISWVDNSGNFWLFGGYGCSENGVGLLNALWKYDVSSNEWTWMNGNKTINEPGIYSAQGTSNSSNRPGARYCSQNWTDKDGNLWLFGGYGFGHAICGELNDIWKYNISTNEWTWIKGDSSVAQIGIYGTKGLPVNSNNPGGRYLSSSWADKNGNLWLFGGYGYDQNMLGSLNDLWKYNSANNEWTWMNGDSTIDQPGIYGAKGISNAANKPGTRYISSSWMDENSSNLWMYGGYGLDEANSGLLNDLWKYNPGTNQWTWVKGDSLIDQLGVYGTQGVSDSSTKSGARYGSVSWADGNGNLWLFGGYGFDGNTSGALNDLWKISNPPGFKLPVRLLHFSGTLYNETTHLQWKTEQEKNFSHFNIERSFDGTHFSIIGSMTGSGNNNRNYYSFTDNLGNQQLQKIYYRLQLVDKDDQFTYSKVLRFDLKQRAIRVTVFPNPAVNSLNLSFAQSKEQSVFINITDMRGITLKEQTENMPIGNVSMNIDVSALLPGAYILIVKNEESAATYHKFIKQ